LSRPGFSFVEALSQCPTYYGRRNKLGTATKMLEWYKENALMPAAYDRLGEEERAGKVKIGELYSIDEPEYTTEYARIVAALSERGDSK